MYPSQHLNCCLPLTEGQQVQQVTEHDLDFVPGPELDQILKFQRLFCLSITTAQTGLESSSQADRSPVTEIKASSITVQSLTSGNPSVTCKHEAGGTEVVSLPLHGWKKLYPVLIQHWPMEL